jgi:peptidoglycan hydrolase CwlO-like protein
MKKCLTVLVLLAWGAVLFSGGAKIVYDFERDTYYGFYWMLDSELHTWVGSSDYVDIQKDVFDYLFNNLIPRNEKIYRDLKNRLRNLESLITSKETEIKTKEKQIEELKGLITSKDAEIKTRDKQIEELKGLITTKEAEINDLKGKLDKRDAEIKTLKDESSQLGSRFITAIVIGIVAVVGLFVVIFVLRRRKTESVT